MHSLLTVIVSLFVHARFVTSLLQMCKVCRPIMSTQIELTKKQFYIDAAVALT